MLKLKLGEHLASKRNERNNSEQKVVGPISSKKIESEHSPSKAYGL
jgi:hypothetical protein